MKTISFLNNKGGVGKTASMITIAHMISEMGKRVLMIDVDPQGNSSSMYSDIDVITLLENRLRKIPEVNIPSVGDLFINRNADIHKCIQHTEYDGLDIIPSLLTLSEIEEQLKADITTPQQFRLKMHLSKIKDEYDYCLIDCSPSINILNINALAASDCVYAPIQCEAWSAIGMTSVMNLVEVVQNYNPNLKYEGFFFTQWNRSENVNIAVYNLLAQYVYNDMIPITICRSNMIKEMSFTQTPIKVVDKNARKKITRDYLRLTEYILSDNKDQLKERYKDELDASINDLLLKRQNRSKKSEK